MTIHFLTSFIVKTEKELILPDEGFDLRQSCWFLPQGLYQVFCCLVVLIIDKEYTNPRRHKARLKLADRGEGNRSEASLFHFSELL